MRIAVAMLVIAAALSGCGADVERQAPSGAFARAEATTREVGSVRLRTTLRAVATTGTADVRGYGAIDFRTGRLAVTMTGTVEGEHMTWESISGAHTMFSRTNGQPWSVARSEKPGGPAYQRAMSGAREPAAQLSIMHLVRKVGRIGTEEIDGVMTTRYGGEVQLAGAEIEPVDFWVDDQWRLRRLRTVTLTRTVRQIATTEFYDYGARIEPIVVPKLG